MGPFSGDYGNSIRNWLGKAGMQTLNSAIKSGLTILSISEHLPLRLGWRLKWHRCHKELVSAVKEHQPINSCIKFQNPAILVCRIVIVTSLRSQQMGCQITSDYKSLYIRKSARAWSASCKSNC